MQTQLKLIFLSFIIILTHNLVNAQANTNEFVVVLDAGHGGKDPGKHSKYGYKEKDIALNIVKQVGAALEKKEGIKVIYTRTTDVFVDLFVRGKIANKANADLFVSVHCNAHHTEAYGTETYVLGLHRNDTNFEVAKSENEVIYLEENYEENYGGFDPSSPESFIGLSLMQEEYLDQSIQLAKNIQSNFSKALKRKNRGIKQAGFIVLHQTVMPSVLVETGFLTNKHEGAYLNSKKGQQSISKAIEEAILEYKKSVELNVTTINNIPVKEELEPVEEKEEEVISSEEKIIKNTIFKVQIAASSKKLEPKAYNFKGLKEISRVKEDKFYKYFYGYTSDINKIKAMKKVAQKKGYKTAYIVAYRDGKRMSLKDALKDEVK